METANRARPDDVAAAIDDATKLIERGWTRGISYRRGRYCLSGALDASAPSFEIRERAHREVMETINGFPTKHKSWFGTITHFNDDQKSKKPVLEVLTQTSKRLRNPEVT